jgi:hypothetical protein
MEGMKNMGFQEAGFAPPMWPITVRTTKSTFNSSTGTTSNIGGGHFKVENELHIGLLVV